MITVALTNESKSLKDSEVKKIVRALQTQVSKHFYPHWGIDARVVFYPRGQQPADAWWLVCLETSDVASALGYHDTTPAGLPLGKAFVGSDLQYGYAPSVTMSHELLEMLGDPEINRVVQVGDTEFFSYETCDACEADQYAYKVGDVLVSDFVTPSWFCPSFPGPYDYAGHIAKPLDLLPGGYIGVWSPHGGWTQKIAEGSPHEHAARPRVGSRRERRRTPRSQWIASTVLTPTTEEMQP
jgi:hypothetical protein